MSQKKLITVLGATGAQGGGLARSILADKGGEFAVRAVTRNVDAPAARALAEAGAEVVAGDLSEPASIHRAFEGAHGAFCVTFFWAHFSPDRELAETRLMAEAAKKGGVQHTIWSTLEDTRRFAKVGDGRMPTLMGKYNVPHFDAKGESDDIFRSVGGPTTFLATSFYWDNLIAFGMGPKRGADGVLSFALPMGDKKLPGIAAEDIGRCAHGVFKKGQALVGKTVGIAGEHLTGAQMADALAHAFGEPVRYAAIPFDVYRGLGFPGADDLGNMFQFKHDFEEAFCGARDVAATRALNPQLQSFAQWLAANKSRIPLS